jgi:hypothetical protein
MTTARIAGRRKALMSRERRLHHAAVPRRIRPRREAAATRCAHRDPDLLEGAPVVCRPLVAEEPASVVLLEREVHLEAAPVGAPGIGPASLVAMDAEPGAELGWVLRLPPGLVGPVLPSPGEVPQPRERARCERPRPACRRAAADHRDPVPRVGAEPADMAPPGGCRLDFPAGRRLPGDPRAGGRACGRSRARAWTGTSAVCRPCGGRRRSGHACEREQEPAGEDGAPQFRNLPVRLQVGGRAGGKVPSEAGTARRGLCDRWRKDSDRRHVCALLRQRL